MSVASAHATNAWNKYKVLLVTCGFTFSNTSSECVMKALFEAIFDEVQTMKATGIDTPSADSHNLSIS